jgi:hypothetical protein
MAAMLVLVQGLVLVLVQGLGLVAGSTVLVTFQVHRLQQL